MSASARERLRARVWTQQNPVGRRAGTGRCHGTCQEMEKAGSLHVNTAFRQSDDDRELVEPRSCSDALRLFHFAGVERKV